MNVWYKLDLGNGMDALPKTHEVEREFTSLFLLNSSRPTGAMLFSRYDLERDNVELFFNPQAADIAVRHNAKPCDKPTPNAYRISLLCADSDGGLLANFPSQSAP
ncbi:hypothetical protein EV687_0920 [Corticibacter populi]|nr:hypothetical protein EV687_0920 [Corticibacter populi]